MQVGLDGMFHVCFKKKNMISDWMPDLNVEIYGHVTTIQFSENIKPVSMHT